MCNETMMRELRAHSSAIYHVYNKGNESLARAMISQLPPRRAPYVIMAMTALAVREKDMRNFVRFIEGLTY